MKFSPSSSQAERPQTVVVQNPSPQDDGDEIHLLDLLDVVLDHFWSIVGITILALLIGFGYAKLSTPIYRADTLIQVEDAKIGGNGLLGDMSGMFDIKSPATAEIELLRSRLVVGEAVENLQLDLNIEPKYIPLIGQWLSRRATDVSEPGFLGMDGYVSGNEALQVESFSVPKALEGQVHTLVLTDTGFQLLSESGQVLGEGQVGKLLQIQYPSGTGELLVSSARGKPGATFFVTRTSRLDTIRRLQNQLNIAEQGKQSGMIRSSLDGDDPVLIASTLNELGRLYVRQNIQRKSAEAAKSLAFLDDQLPQLRSELEASEVKFNQFRDKHGIFDLGGEAQSMLEQGTKLHILLVELQQKRKELEARFTNAHPSIQATDEQIRGINAELATLSERAKNYPTVEQELLRLTRDVKVNNELYTSLLNSVQQLRLVKEGRVGNVRMVDEASPPERPVNPRTLMIVALSGILGLLVALGLAFLRNSLRSGIKDPSEIEQHTHLHVFATVPHSEVQVQQAKAIKDRQPGMHVLAMLDPSDPVVESLRSLRTALQFAMLDASSNLVLFTGPTPGIGKSFTSVNFAAVSGAANKKVLLVDGDMRKGYLNAYFGQDRKGGLSEVISGAVPIEKAIRREIMPNVDFLSTGILPPNPAEILMANGTKDLLQWLSSQYDLVIVDAPPVLAASDAGILAPMVGSVIMLARAEVSSIGELQEASKRLVQTGVQVRGVVFNDLDVAKRRYQYGFGQKYGKYRYTNYQY